MFAGNLFWHFIYTVAERRHRSIVVIVNFEQILPSSVSIVDFEHAFIFRFWSFYISIVFTLRSIQVLSTYRKNFYEIKCFHEVACALPRKMSGGWSSEGNCPGGHSWGGGEEGGNYPRGNYSEVIVQGVFVLGEFHRGQLSRGWE